VKDELLAKYGLEKNNAILTGEGDEKAKLMPLFTDLVNDHEVSYIAGGATQNSIRVAQWMLKEAGSTAYMGCVGNDKFGTQLKDCAKADGVYVHYMEDEEAATGTCAVLVSGGERSLCANLAAANNFKEVSSS
jgi:adenosine kinase